MSATNDDQPSSFQAKRGLLIGGLLLFLAGGLYWFYTTSVSTLHTPASGSITKSAEKAAEATQATTPEVKTAQELPEVAKNSVETEAEEAATVVRYKAAPRERTAKRSVNTNPDDLELAGKSASVVAAPVVIPAPVEKPVVVAAPPVAPTMKPEVTPATKPAAIAAAPANKPAPSVPTAKPKAGVPGELKPVAQPAPPPVTVSAAPILKRKAKNDEDVDVDF
ncbi:hypothetical protein ACAW74_13200 [Fibrella sp. WM1]|uniref:hypothetical protein n=1 Tax=Fibrella musci TaxID=3242485 RepID=UPI00352032FD